MYLGSPVTYLPLSETLSTVKSPTKAATKLGRELASRYALTAGLSPFFHLRLGAFVTRPCLSAFAVTRM